MLGKIFDKILKDDEDEVVEKEATKTLPHEEKGLKIPLWEITIVGLLLLVGLAYRLGFMYLVSGVDNAGAGWYGDTYHHWQIGYLTATVGLKHGFLRLWDLKGMEFFWGPLHPFLLTVIYFITGSSSLAITRIISGLFGLGSLTLLYILARRYWSRAVGLAILFFGAFFPIAVFNDISGMLEPIGLFFLLLGIYFWPKRSFLTGFMWAIATTARAEAWVFSLGLLFGLLFTKEKVERKIMAAVGWVVPMVIYMKYLADWTGNLIYPVYWNFLANGLGAWADMKRDLTDLQLFMRPILIGFAILAVAAILIILYRRKASSSLLLLGWGNVFFVGAFMGIGHYLTGWEWWFPIIRFFVFPYLFMALIIFILFSKLKIGHRAIWTTLLAMFTLLLTVFTQLTWQPIMAHFNTTERTWQLNVSGATRIDSYYNGGNVLFPEDEPNFTYAVIQNTSIRGPQIVGQMFDPYYYNGGMEMYANWKNNRNLILRWLKENDVRLAVIRVDNERYQELIRQEPETFEKLTTLEGGVYDVWRVHSDTMTVDETI